MLDREKEDTKIDVIVALRKRSQKMWKQIINQPADTGHFGKGNLMWQKQGVSGKYGC